MEITVINLPLLAYDDKTFSYSNFKRPKNLPADMVIVVLTVKLVVVTLVMEMLYIHTQILQTLSYYFFSRENMHVVYCCNKCLNFSSDYVEKQIVCPSFTVFPYVYMVMD
jgi:hypothetical protein